jgi:hypothetical protein
MRLKCSIDTVRKEAFSGVRALMTALVNAPDYLMNAWTLTLAQGKSLAKSEDIRYRNSDRTVRAQGLRDANWVFNRRCAYVLDTVLLACFRSRREELGSVA